MSRKQLIGVILFALATPSTAKDFGTYGALFPIHEQDVLELIVSGFVEMENSGRLDEIRQDSERHVRARVERPSGRPSRACVCACRYTCQSAGIQPVFKAHCHD